MVTRRKRRPSALALVGALALCLVSAADAKLSLSLNLSNPTPKTGRPIVAVLKSDLAPGNGCRMRLLAVAPGIGKYRALDAFVIGGVDSPTATGYAFRKIRPTARMGFLVTMKHVGPKTWRTSIRLPRPGAWRLVVPNECAPGYMSPLPVDRVVTVR